MLKSTDSPYAKTLFTAVIKKTIYLKTRIWISMKHDLISNLLVKIEKENVSSYLKNSQTLFDILWSEMVKIKQSIGMDVSGFHFGENDYRSNAIWIHILSRFLSLKSSSVSIFNFFNQNSSKLWSLRFFSLFPFILVQRDSLSNLALFWREMISWFWQIFNRKCFWRSVFV